MPATDFIFIPFGAQTPYIVRRRFGSSEGDLYELIGEASVHGMNDGEAFELEHQQVDLLLI